MTPVDPKLSELKEELKALISTYWVRKRDRHPVQLTEYDDNGFVRLRWKYYGGKSNRPTWWTTWPSFAKNYEPEPFEITPGFFFGDGTRTMRLGADFLATGKPAVPVTKNHD